VARPGLLSGGVQLLPGPVVASVATHWPVVPIPVLTLVTWGSVSRVPAPVSSHASVRRPDSPGPAPHPSSSVVLLVALYSPVGITPVTSSAILAPVPPAHSPWTDSAPVVSLPPGFPALRPPPRVGTRAVR